MSAVNLSFVKFHSGTQTPCSGPTYSAIPLLIDTYLEDIQTNCALITRQRPIKKYQ